MQECRRIWEEEGILYSYDELEKLAEQAESSGIFLNLNMADFAQPGNMPEKIRTFCRRTGQRIPESVGEIVRCIYESLASTYSKELKKLEQGSERRIEKLQILGGGARSEMLCQSRLLRQAGDCGTGRGDCTGQSDNPAESIR